MVLARINAFCDRNFFRLAIIVLLVQTALDVLIIHRVPYTEIDWQAYMQEVGGFLNGEWNYGFIRGDTGPCVYPAGFIHIFSVLSMLTGEGKNIVLAQYLFAIAHALLVALLLIIYNKARIYGTKGDSQPVVPALYALILLCASRRIHSIFVLRLFNDCIVILFVYMAVVALLYNQWSVGCILFSLAISVKMNALLFIPGLLVLLVKRFGLYGSIPKLFLMLLVQLLVGIPFLIGHPKNYLHAAYDFGRKFFYIWTVNFRFLPEPIFQSDLLAKGLLFSTALVLVIFGLFKWTKYEGGISYIVRVLIGRVEQQNNLTAEHIVTVLFTSNFVGFIFSRSMHYQFYVWYYHTLPYLLWSSNFLFTSWLLPASGTFRDLISLTLKVVLLIAVEICWNVYPSTYWSSLSLTVSHALLLVSLLFSQTKPPTHVAK